MVRVLPRVSRTRWRESRGALGAGDGSDNDYTQPVSCGFVAVGERTWSFITYRTHCSSPFPAYLGLCPMPRRVGYPPKDRGDAVVQSKKFQYPLSLSALGRKETRADNRRGECAEAEGGVRVIEVPAIRPECCLAKAAKQRSETLARINTR
jgi:hypothetical protein